MNSLKKVLGTSMALLFAATLSQQATADHGATIRLSELQIPWIERVHSHYEINKDLGRAWVLLEVRESFREDDVFYKRVAVPGMHFDNSTGQVVLNKNGQNTVCAQLEQRRILGIPSQRLAHTGECRIETHTKQVSVDDGFFVKPRNLTITTLSVGNSGNHQS